MIEIKEKKDCCGCGACEQACPRSCITMQEDNEGFLYPNINKAICIKCGLCNKVCPVINQARERSPLTTYAAKHKDEQIRLESSSGGIFTAIAQYVIKKGGIVFGARFDKKWCVIHDYTETEQGLAAFRGAKYVQSQIGESYINAEFFLKKGRLVLFSGTPCQIAGLKRFLRKEYRNLLTIDFICHGVPSPMVWHEYLNNKITHRSKGENTTFLSHSIENKEDIYIENISFRDKKSGWKKYSITITFSIPDGIKKRNSISISEPFNKNIFLRGFLANLYLRPSCYACPAKNLKSQSDITIGDFWGIQNVLPNIDDDKGISVIIVNSMNGEIYIKMSSIEKWPVLYNQILNSNRSIILSAEIPRKRELFFKAQKPFEETINKLLKTSVLAVIVKKIRYRVRRGCAKICK